MTFAIITRSATVDAGPGGLVAGPAGVVVGNFVWTDDRTRTGLPALDPNDAPKIVRNISQTSRSPLGIIHREQQGLITNYLGGTEHAGSGGFPVTVHQAGGFFVKNTGAARATLGMKAFANLADGTIQFAAAGATVAGAIETKWFATSAADPGVTIKISSWPLG